MKSRVLRIKLGERLRVELDEGRWSRAEICRHARVAPQTLLKMINDDWRFITREPVERVADLLGLDLSEVFEFVPVDFWKQIEERKCIFLRGTEEPIVNHQRISIPRSDSAAMNEITTFLNDSIPGFTSTDLMSEAVSTVTTADLSEGIDKLMEQVRSENCIVIGSPKTNTATEILLSEFFKAEPFNPDKDNRKKIPFGFCWTDRHPIVEKSSLTCSAFARKKTKNIPGIAIRSGPHIPAHYRSPTAFYKWETRDGRDCGLVFVANRPFGADRDVKLIVLAGFSGTGTLAAARGLVKDFRYLEPINDEKCVYGVVEGTYRKFADTDNRNLTDFDWKYRKGGRAPVNVQTRKKRSAKK